MNTYSKLFFSRRTYQKKNDTLYVLSPSSFKKIKSHLKYALVYEKAGYYFIQIGCRYRYHYDFIIMDGVIQSSDPLCQICTNRFLRPQFSCRKEFIPLDETMYPDNFSYLEPLLKKYSLTEDNRISIHLLDYFDGFDDISTSTIITLGFGLLLLPLFIPFYLAKHAISRLIDVVRK